MKIAYIILAHKLPEQLVRLVRKLDTECSWFFIHIDKNTDGQTYRKMWEPLSSQRNVRFLERSACSLGNFSLLKPTLEGIKEILDTDLKIDYLFALSGQDYPLKSNNHILKYLKLHEGQSFLEYFPLPDDRWKEENGGLNRIVYWHFHWHGRGFSIRRSSRFVAPLSALLGPVLSSYLPIERKIPENLKPFGGSAWWCLSREGLEYVGDLMSRDKGLVKFFQHVSIPSEIFYQTVLMNSPLKNRIMNDDLHYIHWPPNVAPHPYVLQKNEFEEFIHTDKLFARKFDTTLYAEVLDMIDEVTSRHLLSGTPPHSSRQKPNCLMGGTGDTERQSTGSACRLYVNPEVIDGLIVDHANRRQGYKRHLFSQLTFEVWDEEVITSPQNSFSGA